MQLQQVADSYCEKPAIKRDFKFRDQFADAAASGPRNIAEGFGCYFHPEFARFARIAHGSEPEVINHLRSAKSKGYISPVECDDGIHAARRAIKVLTGLIRYLDETPDWGR